VKETIVVLRVRDDKDDRPWWEALKLPAPWAWSNEETFGLDVFPTVELDEEVKS